MFLSNGILPLANILLVLVCQTVDTHPHLAHKAIWYSSHRQLHPIGFKWQKFHLISQPFCKMCPQYNASSTEKPGFLCFYRFTLGTDKIWSANGIFTFLLVYLWHTGWKPYLYRCHNSSTGIPFPKWRWIESSQAKSRQLLMFVHFDYSPYCYIL